MSDTTRQPDWQTPDGAIQLYCGDCLEILPLLEAGSVDVVVTDPPYGHNNNNGDLIHRWEAALGKGDHGEARAIPNDGVEANTIYRDSLPHLHRLLKPGCCCCCCCCGGGGPDPQFARWSLWMDEVFNFKQMVVWDKGPMGMGWHYRRSYETVLVGEKPGAACAWFGGNNKENIIRPGQYGIRKIIPQANQHPCAKPIELYAHFIKLHSQSGGVALDPFMGEAPCAVACIRTGRRFIGIELERKYFDIAVKRIERALEDQALFAHVQDKTETQGSLLDDPAA
jgi:site-specific DNA-methyltransferase (adenine-specific)